GMKIHCTCKRNFFSRVKKLQVGQWKCIENFSVTPATGKYRATSHKYKMSITGSTNVTNSDLKIDDDFLTLTPLQPIMNGSLDSNFLVDVIGRAIDIGDVQAVQVGGKENKRLELTLIDSEVPNNELAISSGSDEIEKPKVIKRQSENWSIYPDRSILDILQSTEVSLLSIESEDTKGASLTPVSKRSGSSMESQIDDLTSASKKQRFKNIKLEKNDGE
ncbi:unnamed protein product, partial [Eruca vesicaria subsp. sativa]|nr:unnamed protein product [Eruca vesicaria subsp. sativa]